MVKVPDHIFRSYDIRGVYPYELDETLAGKIGKAFVHVTQAKKIVVGRDMRTSAPSLTSSLIESLVECGVEVTDIGEVPVDAVTYALGKKDFDGSIYCTASHNPREYSGFKMYKRGMKPVRGTDLKASVHSDSKEHVSAKGSVVRLDITKEFTKYILSFVDLKAIRPYTVVVDAGNGMAGKSIALLESQLPIRIIPLFFELDGSFPNRPSNPLEKEGRVAVSAAVRESNADLGVMFDGDTDRVFFLDEKGDFIPADITLLLLARSYIIKNPGAGVVYNAICSRAVPEFITEWGGHAYRCKVGSVNVKEMMEETGSLVGGEVSAHYAFKEHFFADSGHIAFLKVLEVLSRESKPLPQIVSPMKKYYRADEINIKVKNPDVMIQNIAKKYTDGKQDFLDGVTVSYERYWFNVRASNTEPLIRLTVEANNINLLQQKKEELVNILTQLS